MEAAERSARILVSAVLRWGGGATMKEGADTGGESMSLWKEGTSGQSSVGTPRRNVKEPTRNPRRIRSSEGNNTVGNSPQLKIEPLKFRTFPPSSICSFASCFFPILG